MTKKIPAEMIPALEGQDVLSARAWFSKVGEIGLGPIHADDSYDSSAEGSYELTPQAVAKANAIKAEMFEVSRGWADPDFIYDLAGQKSFLPEADYPGFVIDRSVEGASRTGWQSVPGMELPTIVVEEGGSFFMLQFDTATGRLSESAHIRIVPASGFSFNPGNERYIAAEEVDGKWDEAVVVDHFDDIGAAIERLAFGPKP